MRSTTYDSAHLTRSCTLAFITFYTLRKEVRNDMISANDRNQSEGVDSGYISGHRGSRERLYRPKIDHDAELYLQNSRASEAV